MIIAIDKNGGATFYDIVKIKESDSSNDAPNGVVRTNALSTNSISETSENVNPETAQTTKKFALSAKNSQDDTLSEQQRAYFADSKVVDRSGKLLVLYHQTNADFTVFGPKHEGAGGGRSGYAGA